MLAEYYGMDERGIKHDVGRRSKQYLLLYDEQLKRKHKAVAGDAARS